MSGGGFESLKALVVDDNAHMRSLLRALLNSIGIKDVAEANHGGAALEALRDRKSDLVLSDMQMKPMDGIEFTRLVRNSEMSPNPFVPIIMISGHTERHRVEVARDAGVTEFLAKPITATNLFSRICEIVERPRAFVRTQDYFGPDRRRHQRDDYAGPWRRANDFADTEGALMPAKPQAQMIAPDAYPQMMTGKDVAQAMATLRSAQTKAKAQGAMQAAVPPMRAAILQLVDDLEACGQDMVRVFDTVHEIRGFAETAGLVTTGRIADILCRYMDDMNRLGMALDRQIVTLHVAAINRAARAEDDDVTMGEMVAAQLAQLVTRRLLEAQGTANS